MNTTLAPSASRLASAAIAGQVVFTIAWLVLGALEGHGYSIARHTQSDLGALTAHHAPLMLAAQVVAGILTAAFAILVLRPSLAVPGKHTAVGAWFVACSLVGAELAGELIFRLDCRAADAGCSFVASTASRHGKGHFIVGIAPAVMTLAAPFVLARRMRLVAGFKGLVRPAIVFGVVNVITMVGYGMFEHSSVSGYLSKGPLLLGSIGVIVLATRAKHLRVATVELLPGSRPVVTPRA